MGNIFLCCSGNETRMRSEELVKWLESLKSEIGKIEYRSLWHYEQVLDMAIEAIRNKPNND